MTARLTTDLDQRTVMRLSTQQLRFVKLLELSAPELEEAVQLELAENPALEEVDDSRIPAAEPTVDGERFSESPEQLQKADYAHPDDIPAYRLDPRNGRPETDWSALPQPDDGESIYDNLHRQVAEKTLDPEVRAVADYIVGSLDSNGYLRRDKSQLADDMAFSTGTEPDGETLAAAIEVVRSLDPPGIGASDLRECLMLQLKAMPGSETRDDALEILEKYFPEFSMKHTHRIISQMKIPAGRVRGAVDLILTLNPKPGAALGSSSRDTAAGIIPDFVIGVDRDQITVALPGSTDLRIEESFAGAVARMQANTRSRAARKGNEFVISRYNAARDFIQLVRQRRETLFSVMTAIVKLQKEYFLTQDVHELRPMMIKDISALTGYDISVISRATNNKYAATPWGIFPLRFFFSDGMGEEGDEFTNREVEAEIREIVEAEDKRHPLSDEKIRLALLEKGYEVSRRTVAKYRDRMKIPVARLRRDL